MIGHSLTASESWKSLPWKQFQKTLFRLQKRVYKAVRAEDIHTSIRYADDMVIILKPNDNAEAILNRISEFLAVRGMNVNERKTKVTATTDGFNFLGWHFKVQKNGKFRSSPSAANYIRRRYILLERTQ
jgi:hypothetical protein